MNDPRFRPHVHEVEPEAGERWRCLAAGCGWVGAQTEAIHHAVKHQWSEPGLRATVTNAPPIEVP